MPLGSRHSFLVFEKDAVHVTLLVLLSALLLAQTLRRKPSMFRRKVSYQQKKWRFVSLKRCIAQRFADLSLIGDNL
jgi:hypothetical protein